VGLRLPATRWIALGRERGGVTLWDWTREKTLRLRPPAGHEKACPALVHTVRCAATGSTLVVAVMDAGSAVWGWSVEGSCTPEPIPIPALRDDLHTNPTPRPSSLSQLQSDHRARSAQNELVQQGASPELDGQHNTAHARPEISTALRLRVKLSSRREIERGELAAAPDDREVRDACRVTSRMGLGVTADHVLLLRDGAVLLREAAWAGPDGRRTDPRSGRSESLLCVAANDRDVCVASDFGNLHILERETLTWQRTVSIGELCASLVMPCWGEPYVAFRTVRGETAVLDLGRAGAPLISFVEDPLETARAAAEEDARMRAAQSARCPACGFSPGSTKPACVMRSSCTSHWVCRSATGKTVVRCRRTRERHELVSKAKGSSHAIRWVAQRVLVVAERADTLAAFVLHERGGTRVRRFPVGQQCVSFDVDRHWRNRVVALRADGGLRVFRFTHIAGEKFDQVAPIAMELHARPRDSALPPTLLAAQYGKIAVAARHSVTVLVAPGRSDCKSVELDSPGLLQSLEWAGPQHLIGNNGALSFRLDE